MSRFIGDYSKELQELFELAILTNQNAVAVTPPGYGKSELALSLARAYAIDKDHGVSFIEINPTTKPDKIEGKVDLQAAIKDQEIRRDVTGTPYDERTEIVVFDEVSRASAPLFDLMLHILNPVKGRRLPCLATANFLPDDERTEAMLDRFSFYFFMAGEQVDTFDLLTAQSGEIVPTYSEEIVDAVRSMRWEDWPDASKKAAVGIIDILEKEAVASGLQINPRRKVQWAKTLLAVTYAVNGLEPEFSKIAAAAVQALRFSFPARSLEEYLAWVVVSRSVTNKMETAIESVKIEVFQILKDIVDGTDGQPKSVRMISLGTKVAEAEDTLREMFGETDEVEACIEEIKDYMRQAVRGEVDR